MIQTADLPSWVPLSFALLGGVILLNALLMQRLGAEAAGARRQWLISGARNLASLRASARDVASGTPYSILEPVQREDNGATALAGLLYALLTAVIGYAIFAANERAATVVVNASFLEVLWAQAREVLFFTFVATCFSGLVLVSQAASHGILKASTFVRATTNTILASLASLLMLLVIQIAAPGEMGSAAAMIAWGPLWRIVLALALLFGLLPLLLLVLKLRRADLAMAEIEGLSLSDRLRLAAHGLSSVAQLAVANPARLYVTSGIDAYKLVACLAQAQVVMQPPIEGEKVQSIFEFSARLRATNRHEIAAAIEASPTFQALMQFRQIVVSPEQELSTGTPAVLGGILEQRVTSAVREAMFGEPKVRYSGWLKFELVLGESEPRSGKRAFTARLHFTGMVQDKDGWTRLDILDGVHQELVDFRIRFDSDASDFDSVESTISVPSDGTRAVCEAQLSIKIETLQHVWASIVQGSRTVQVVELIVPESAGQA